MVDASRRAFFRGRARPRSEPRPPWASEEALFIDRCTRCGDCQTRCPQAILIPGDGGYPTLRFDKAECTFCGACVDACPTDALHRQPDQAPWAYQAHIGETCLPRHGIECRVCGDYCDARAICFPPRLGGSALPEIDPELCTGCGACVAPCPANAVRIGP